MNFISANLTTVCTLCILSVMDLRVRDVDPDLMAQWKAKAALAKMTLSQWVVEMLKKVGK